MKIWTWNTQFLKNIISRLRSEVNHWRGCHINFIKPKTYSALLPPKAYDSPQLRNELMRFTKHFLQNFQILGRMYDTFLTIVCGLNAYLSRNIFHVHLNIIYLHFNNPTTAKTNVWANTFQFPRNQVLTSTFPTWRNFSTTWIICDHRHPNQRLSHMATRIYEHHPKFLISNFRRVLNVVCFFGGFILDKAADLSNSESNRTIDI
jgi:hypothetical protein